ncbi:MAG: AAA family ATPase [Alphaproteobacteria bacterium]
MRSKFVRVGNVRRFIAGVEKVKERVAPEASLMLSIGEPGHGKSQTAEWWAVQNDALFIRCKAACVPYWMLSDLARSLGLQPKRSCQQVFEQIYGELGRNPRPVVIDEIEHAVGGDMKSIESLRDLTDLIGFTLILSGRPTCQAKLRAQPQIWRRLSAVVEFAPVALDDVQLCVDELAEVPISPAIVEEIHRQSEGRIQQALNGIANVERMARRKKGDVVLGDFAGQPLFMDWQKLKVAA